MAIAMTVVVAANQIARQYADTILTSPVSSLKSVDSTLKILRVRRRCLTRRFAGLRQ